MSKPTISELLIASGHSDFTLSLFMRAMYALSGNIGANLDERNWSAIMNSSNPMEASELALQTQYQDDGYLLRNTQHLIQSGYIAAQAEVTYRQIADRMGFTHNASWSEGTGYEYLGELTFADLVALAPAAPSTPPEVPATPSPQPQVPATILPTMSVSGAETGFTVVLNVAGIISLSASGTLASFAAGSTVLGEQTTLKEGFLRLSVEGITSPATSSYVVLGSGGGDSFNANGAGDRVDYVFGGAGNDSIRGGAGNDILLGGTGDDLIHGDEGDDSIYGGKGNDTLQGGTGDDTITGGAGSDTITGNQGADSIALGASDEAVDRVIYSASGDTASGQFASGGSTSAMDIISDASMDDVIDLWDVFSVAPAISTAFLSAATANNAAIVRGNLNTGTNVFSDGIGNDYMVQWTDGTAIHSIVLKDFGLVAPTFRVDVPNDTLTLVPVYNVINGTAGIDTLNGTAGHDMIIGGAGIDIMTGGDGDDAFIIASSADHGTSNNGERISGGNGVDVIRFTSTTPNETLILSYWIDVEEVRIVAADGSENSTAGLSINADFLGVGPNIKLYGNAGNNTLVGNYDGVNTIEGGDGNDTITGGFRDDVLIGDAGADTITGREGADSLTGGDGADTLTGGSDADTFVYSALAQGGAAVAVGANVLAAGDTITDFVSGSDKIDVTAGTTIAAAGSGTAGGWNIHANGLYVITGSTLNFIQGITTSAHIASAIGGIQALSNEVGYVAILDNQGDGDSANDTYSLFEVSVGASSYSGGVLNSDSTISLIGVINSNTLLASDFIA